MKEEAGGVTEEGAGELGGEILVMRKFGEEGQLMGDFIGDFMGELGEERMEDCSDGGSIDKGESGVVKFSITGSFIESSFISSSIDLQSCSSDGEWDGSLDSET